MSRRGLAIVVSVQFAALIAVCWLVGDNGWDDGAITVAFARTFARTGLVALTPHSEVVEGFSSVSWFLLNAAAALGRPSFGASIFVSQALATVFICASTVLLARTCALLGLSRLLSTLTVIAFAAWGGSVAEASNGMEMGLLAAAFLVMINELLAPRPRALVLGAAVVLAVATRFESAFCVGLLALSVASVAGRRAFWTIVVAGAGAVLLLSIWRLATFSDLLPNTFWAKRWPPYTAVPLVLRRLRGALELPSLFLAPVIALVIARLSGFDLRSALRARRRVLPILAAPVLGAVVIGALVGKPWGYYGRMPYFAVPPALLLVALAAAAWVNAGPGRRRGAAVAAVYALVVGASMVGFPSGAVGAALRGGSSFGVTPHTYAETGRSFRRVAAAADLPHAVVATPDVGGVALCCDDLEIVDLALLSNRLLAHRGHGALAEVLETRSPAMIEAHWEWASAGHLYELPGFRANYLPAFVDRTKFWVRRDVAQAIVGKGRGCWLPAAREDVRAALRAHRYARQELPPDRTAFERSPIVFALDDYCVEAGRDAPAGK